MNRQQKEAAISGLKDMFSRADGTFLVNYKGLSVSQMQKFRNKLREGDGLLRVSKARLMKLAASDLGSAENFKNDFKDQVGLVFALKESTTVAKKIVDFSKENEALKIISGLFESKILTKDQILSLAAIPSREVLLAQLVGALQAPIAGLAYTLNMFLVKFVYVLSEVARQKSEKQQ